MPELVATKCPSCHQEYQLPASLLGRKARCKRCHAVFVIETKPTIDDDTVVSWICDEGALPVSSGALAGAFEDREDEPASVEAAPSSKAAIPADSGALPLVELIGIDQQGAHFEFPAATLVREELRSSFPCKCVGCLDRHDLWIHLIHWPERMPALERTKWRQRMTSAIGRLGPTSGRPDLALLRRLPRPRHLAGPFDLPFPLFACKRCDVAEGVQPHVVTRHGEDVCQLSIASLAVAVSFYRNNGGRATHGYQRLVEARDLKRDAWRHLAPEVRARLSRWFEPRPQEHFVQFFRDTEFPAAQAGAAGIVLTDQRIVCQVHAERDEYSLASSGRMEIMRKGDLVIAHIYQEGARPAVLKLDTSAVDDLVANLRRLHCHWVILS